MKALNYMLNFKSKINVRNDKNNFLSLFRFLNININSWKVYLLDKIVN